MAVSITTGDHLIVQVLIWDPPMSQVAVLNRYWTVATEVIPGPVTFADVALTLDSLLSALYKPLIYNSAIYQGCRVRRVYPANVDGWGTSIAGVGTGTGGTVALPTQATGLARLFTDFIGATNEGRQYIPFPSVTSNETTGKPNAQYITDAKALAAQLVAPVTAAPGGGGTFDLLPILWRPRAPAGFTLLKTSTASGSWATQKRRGAYGRLNIPAF